MARLTTACVLALALACAPAASAAEFHDAGGLQVVSVKQVNPRLVALVVETSALPRPANVYVLLPPGYDSHPKKRWPVFYLMHGTSGTASDWTLKGDAQKVIGDRELITVMPDIALNADGGGWCTDWPNGAEKWETFHIGQLIPWVDANLRTIPKRGKRAIAGLSQGGFCSLSYAARHPDLFATALGYSGAPDVYYDPEARLGAMAIVGATEVGLTHVSPNTFFGDQLSNGINWAAHDPASIAENLRWTRMYMYWGNGVPGPLDSDPVSPLGGASEIEGAVNQSNVDFQRRLNALGIPAAFHPYGPGTHVWGYWTRDLQWSIENIMSDFAHPSPKLSRFTYTSGDDRYAVYGWRVAMQRTAREFSTLAGERCGGFSLTGSGSGTVTTPACLKRGARYAVTMTGPNAHSSSEVVTGSDRRLELTVPLGPANPYQEETAQARVAGTARYTTYVTIKRIRAARWCASRNRHARACARGRRAYRGA
jgi:S-formylglutathione hydrolase FrmB